MRAAGLTRKSPQSLLSFITVATDRVWELADMVAVIEAWEAEEEGGNRAIHWLPRRASLLK